MRKKILAIMLAITATVLLVACGPEVVSRRPSLQGVRERVVIEVGEDYDPLEGVTAVDGNGVDITENITHTFQEVWVNQAGSHTYTVTIEANGLTDSKNVTLIVGSDSDIVITAPSAVTHYIGTIEFDPLLEATAYNRVDGEPVELELEGYDPFFANVPGKNSYVVQATDDEGRRATQTITLTTKPQVEIANTLSTEPIVINMWHANGTTIEDALKEYAVLFGQKMAAEGYNITVNIQNNGSNYDELRTNFVNALKGAELPNLIQNYPDHVVEYSSHGAIASVLPYIHHPVWGLDPENPEEAFLDILESYRREQRAVTLDGDYLSFPFNKSTEVIAYNKDMFDDVLLGQAFPETWQELFALAPALIANKDRHIDQIATRWAAAGSPIEADEIATIKQGFVPFTYDSKANAFITLVRQFGGSYTGRNSDGKGQLQFDNETTRVMLDFFGENQDYFTIPERWEVSYASDMFKKGYTAVAVGSTGGVRYNTPQEKGTKLFNIGIAPMLYDADTPGARSVIQQGTNISLTTAGSPDQKIASWLFLKFLSSAEIQEDFAVKTGYSPIRQSVYEREGFLTYAANKDTVIEANYTAQGMTQQEYINNFELHVKAMASSVITQTNQYQFFDTPFIGSSATRTAVGVAFERVILRTGALNTAIENSIAYAVSEANKVIG